MGIGRIPVTNLYESLVFFAWSVNLFYLVVERKYGSRTFGAFVMPIAFFTMLFAVTNDSTIQPLVPALQSYWLHAHVITCFVGYAAFAVSAGVAVMYLLKARQEAAKITEGIVGRMPSSRVLDDLVYRAIIWGFPFLTVGIITGAAWANYAWGTYWSWDPKETWSLIVWLVYAVYLHARITRGWHGKRAAILSIVGFAGDPLLLPRRQPACSPGSTPTAGGDGGRREGGIDEGTPDRVSWHGRGGRPGLLAFGISREEFARDAAERRADLPVVHRDRVTP